MMHLLHTALFCSALVSAAPRVLSSTNSIAQLTPRGALIDQSLARMTNAAASAIAPTCWSGNIKWPQNDLPPPVEDKPIRQLSIFNIPASTPNTLIVHNYCAYDIHYLHLNGPSTLDTGLLKAGASYTAPLSGTVWKASKTSDMAKVMLAEYNVPQGTNDLWYNLSLIECLASKDSWPTTDTSACAGHEAGLQFGNKQFKSYQCAPGMWCDDQAYLYRENLCKHLNPVSVCKADMGVTLEFCAANKK